MRSLAFTLGIITKFLAMKSLHYTLLILFLSPLFAGADNLYLLLDERCMDRLEFEFQNKDMGDDYYVYHVRLNQNEKIIFEIGVESSSYQNFPPAQYINCDNAGSVLNKETVIAINNRIDKVFVVRKQGRDRFYLSPVLFAAYYSNYNNTVEYLSPKYQFRFNSQSAVFGENVSLTNNANVVLDARLDNVCSGSFVLRRFAQYESNPYTDIVFVPEIGVVEERSGQRQEDALANALTLKEVNGDKLSKYLKLICTDQQMTLTDDVLVPRDVPSSQDYYYEPTISYDPPTYSNTGVIMDPTPLTGATTSTPPATRSGSNYHTVQKGETLWRISQKYDVSVDQIKSWNSLRTNLIHSGDQLIVKAPTGITSRGLTTNTNTGVAVSSELATRSAQMPAPYDELLYDKGGTSWKSTDGTHIVKRGETVAYLALKYGYTEARFREINKLGPNEPLFIGQPLRTTDCDTAPGEGNPYVVTPYDYSSVDTKGTTTRVDEENFYGDLSRNIPVFYDRPEEATSRYPVPPTNYDNSSNSEVFFPRGYDYSGASVNPNAKNRTMHTVADGENLYRIALKYGVTVDYLRRINNLEASEVLIPYQKIYID